MKTPAESVPPGSRGWVLRLVRHQVEIFPGRFTTLPGLYDLVKSSLPGGFRSSPSGKKRPIALETFLVTQSIAFWLVAFPFALLAFPLLTVIQTTTSGFFGSGQVLAKRPQLIRAIGLGI